MQLNYKQSQFELFPGVLAGSERVNKPRFLISSLTLSMENIVILGIVILMTIILSFTAGVEKGKLAVSIGTKAIGHDPVISPIQGALASRISPEG